MERDALVPALSLKNFSHDELVSFLLCIEVVGVEACSSEESHETEERREREAVEHG